MGATKNCPDCKRVLPAEAAWFSRKKENKTGLYTYCKPCARARVKGRKHKNNWPLSATKPCPDCGKEYPRTIEFFASNKGKAGGLSAYCRECKAARLRSWRAKNPQERRLAGRKRYAARRERIRRDQRAWREQNLGRARKRDRDYMRNRRQTVYSCRFLNLMRPRVWKLIKSKGFRVAGGVEELLGRSAESFVDYIRRQLPEGMAFENFGEWHLHHIVPCAAFDLSDPQEQRACFSWKNYAPLWAAENIKRGATLPSWDDIPAALQAICTPRIKSLLQKVKKEC